MCLISQAAGKGEYILTGLEVYLYREPCLMCAMALSHSRIAKLFFIENNPLRLLILKHPAKNWQFSTILNHSKVVL